MDKSITSSFGGFRNAVLDLISMVESYPRACFEIADFGNLGKRVTLRNLEAYGSHSTHSLAWELVSY